MKVTEIPITVEALGTIAKNLESEWVNSEFEEE